MPVPALIALGVLAAAAIAGSQYSASEQEAAAKRGAKRRKDQEEQDALMQYWQRRAAEAAERSGFATMNEAGTELRNAKARRDGFDATLKEAAEQADATRNMGYINAGSTIASGIAGGAFSGLDIGGEAASALSADQMANAAGQYSLDASKSLLLAEPGQYSAPKPQQQLGVDDGMGGWQLPTSLSGDYDQTPGYQRKLRLYG